MGDSLCHLSHGYLAGVLTEILGRKTELQLEHSGTNACKKRLRMK
jgi:predicted hydrocarbon binding protein